MADAGCGGLSVAGRAAILVGLAAALGAGANFIGPRRIPWTPGGAGPGGAAVGGAAGAGAPSDVSLAGLRSLRDAAAAVVVDARLPRDYEAGHIPGALNVPYVDFEGRLGEFLPRIQEAAFPGPDTRRVLVVYCDGGDCESSKGLMEKLRAAGAGTLLLYSGGWEEWFRSGEPAEVGPGPGDPGNRSAEARR